MSLAVLIAVLAALVGSALMAGAFFAFSSFIMKALGRRPAAEGIAAMQSINVVVINPLFLGAFMGTALVCVGIGVAAVVAWGQPHAPWLLAGALAYFVGTFLVTGAGNVPLNERLAAASATDPDSVALWEHYRDRWTFLNSVRTVASIVAVLLFVFGLRAA